MELGRKIWEKGVWGSEKSHTFVWRHVWMKLICSMNLWNLCKVFAWMSVPYAYYCGLHLCLGYSSYTHTPPLHAVAVQRSTPHFSDKYPYVRYSYGTPAVGASIISASSTVSRSHYTQRDRPLQQYLDGSMSMFGSSLSMEPRYGIWTSQLARFCRIVLLMQRLYLWYTWRDWDFHDYRGIFIVGVSTTDRLSSLREIHAGGRCSGHVQETVYDRRDSVEILAQSHHLAKSQRKRMESRTIGRCRHIFLRQQIQFRLLNSKQIQIYLPPE